MFAAVTTDQWIQIAIVGVTALAALKAAFTAWLNVAEGQKRAQPLVISNETRERTYADATPLHRDEAARRGSGRRLKAEVSSSGGRRRAGLEACYPAARPSRVRGYVCRLSGQHNSRPLNSG